MQPITTLDAIRNWSLRRPDRVVFRYEDAAPGTIQQLTYAELAQRVLRAAAVLRQRAEKGSRVALLLPNSLEYVVGFFGAQAAGMIPVPLMPAAKATRERGHRLAAVLADCSPGLCLVPSCEDAGVSYPTVSVSELRTGGPESCWPAIEPNDIAFLQYTSGSTATPRGVVVRHANLFANHLQVVTGLQLDETTVFGGWLPLFHDMGIIGKVIFPVFLGASSYLITPETFLRRPRRWLEMLSDRRVQISAAPNFGYDYCVDKIKKLEGLDLSHWMFALNGSEPVRAETLDAFCSKFEPAGFRREFFRPVYGMAEATLFVTGAGRSASYRELVMEGPTAGATGKSARPRRHVSVGRAWGDGEVVVARDGAQGPLPEREVGEIFVAGGHCCDSYFNKPDLSQQTFAAELPGRPGRRYLRTGDLGFVQDGELFITGRKKELIIVRGRNYCPDDIERAAQDSQPELVAHGGAAVQVEVDQHERVVLIQEIERPARSESDARRLKNAISEAVASAVGIPLYDVILLRRGMLPKTTSGKIARMRARELLLTGQLGEWGVAHSANAEAETRTRAMVAWWRAAAGRFDLRGMDERRCITPPLVLELGNRGLLGLRAPVAAGGSELGAAQMLRVIREVASVDLNLSSFLGVHNGLALAPILRFGSEAQKADLVPKLASGRALGCFALTERDAGSNVRALRSTARRTSDGWRLNGRKIWIGNASWSSVALFFAQTYDRDGTYLGITAFLLPSDTAGVRQGPETLTLGMRGMVQNELVVEDADVGVQAVLGRVGHGFEVAESTITFGRLGVATMALGCMLRMQQWLFEYAQHREIATGRLLAHPRVAGRLFSMQVSGLAIGAAVDRCTALLDQDRQVPLEILSSLKAVATELAWECVDGTLQAFGGRGYDEANGIAQALRDCRLLRIFEGSSEALFAHVGHASESPDSEIWAFLSSNFPSARRAQEECRADLVRLRELCRTLSPSPERGDHLGRYVAAGEAVGYLLLEASLSSTECPPDVSEHGAAWFARRRRTILREFEETLSAPWRRGDLSSLQQMAAVLGTHLGAYRPAAMNVKWAPDEDSFVASSPITSPEPEPEPEPFAESSGIAAPPEPEPLTEIRPPLLGPHELSSWIADWIHRRTRKRVDSHDRRFVELGLDSIDATEMAADLSDAFDLELDPTALWQFPDVRSLTAHLVARLAKERRGAPPEQTEPTRPVSRETASDELDLIARLDRELRD